MTGVDQKRPNILFIMTDQQRGDCLSIEGHPVLLTPNMDGIAEKGARFTHFYSGSPSCIAARRSILSGQHASTHGMVGYLDGVEWGEQRTLPGELRRNGYQTALVGRSMHQFPPDRRFGYDTMKINGHMGPSDYDRWLEEAGPADSGGWFGGGVMHNDWTARPWHLDDHLHFTNWTVTQALEFLTKRDTTAPFFLTVSFIAPHPPLQPPAFYLDRYIRTGVPEPVIGDWAVPPEGMASGGEGVVAPNSIRLTGEALLSTRAAYYGLINHVDDQINRLLNGVTGVDRITGNNTVVVFTSDHGEMLGDHYMWRKSRAYEASARIPFLIRAPDRFGIETRATHDAPATLADIMPTLLDVAGIDLPDSVEGESLLPLLRGEKVEWREYVHIEHAPDHQSVTDGREKYIWLVPDGKEQFFDLSTDPEEKRDLSSDLAYADKIELWRNRLIETLSGRTEGFTDGKRLIPGVRYEPVSVVRTKEQR